MKCRQVRFVINTRMWDRTDQFQRTLPFTHEEECVFACVDFDHTTLFAAELQPIPYDFNYFFKHPSPILTNLFTSTTQHGGARCVTRSTSSSSGLTYSLRLQMAWMRPPLPRGKVTKINVFQKCCGGNDAERLILTSLLLFPPLYGIKLNTKKTHKRILEGSAGGDPAVTHTRTYTHKRT